MTLEVRDARPEDLRVLSRKHARAFHPTSPYMTKCMPDLPTVWNWWERVFRFAVEDPNSRLAIVTDSSRDGDIIAFARWRVTRGGGDGNMRQEEQECHEASSDPSLMKSDGDLGAGLWSLLELTPDHDFELYNSFVVFMDEQRRSFMRNRPHLLIELVGTVYEAQRTGAGRLVMHKICAEADRRGVEIFVETNGPIVPFYQKFGFVEKARIGMPGGFGYEEVVLIRDPVPVRAERNGGRID